MNINLKVLGISTSPRTNGNSDLLLRRALAGAKSVGANTEYILLSEYCIGPCTECNLCNKTGRCIIDDEYQMVLEKLLDADRLIFATPIFFMSVCAQAKMLIDRGQCLWVYRHVLKRELFNPARDRRAMIVAVGGSRGIKQFDSIRRTMKSYFDVLWMNYFAGLYVNQVDERGDIEKHSSAMNEAYHLGSILGDINVPVPDKPIEIELT